MNNARRIFSGPKCKSDINSDKHNTLLTCRPVCLYLVLYIVLNANCVHDFVSVQCLPAWVSV